ncbi:MAG: hypothetical protein R3A79_18370 [Nannocystaceae bacterium]
MLVRPLLSLITAATFLSADVAAAAATPAVEGGPVAEPAPAETVTVTTTTETNEAYVGEGPTDDVLGEVVVEPPVQTEPQQPQEPPPPVYHPNKRRGLGLMITGWSLFVGSYAITALSGAAVIDNCDISDTYDCRKLGGSLMIPVLGPFLATSEVDTMSGRFALIMFPGLAQVAGLSMGIAGTVLFARSRRSYSAAVNHDGVRLTRRANNLRVANMASPTGGGLKLTYRF